MALTYRVGASMGSSTSVPASTSHTWIAHGASVSEARQLSMARRLPSALNSAVGENGSSIRVTFAPIGSPVMASQRRSSPLITAAICSSFRVNATCVEKSISPSPVSTM